MIYSVPALVDRLSKTINGLASKLDTATQVNGTELELKITNLKRMIYEKADRTGNQFVLN
jgi:hypothetical protein